MATLTRWRDNNKNFDEIIEHFKHMDLSNIESKGAITYENFEVELSSNETKILKIMDKEISYNSIIYKFDTVYEGNEPIEERTKKNTGFIVIFYDGIKVSYAINRNSDAQKIIRLLMSYQGKNEIEEIRDNHYAPENDLFIWLIKKVFSKENSFIIDDEKKLEFNSIIGFKGESQDTLTKVSAQGDTVVNLISTLSFVLESDRLHQVKIRLEYTGHENIELTLSLKNVISLDFKRYLGVYEKSSNISFNPELVIFTYLELLPELKSIYYLEYSEEKWNESVKQEFYNDISEDLTNRLNSIKSAKVK